MQFLRKARCRGLRQTVVMFVLAAFISSGFIYPLETRAQTLPTPGTMLAPTASFVPAVIKAVKVFPENPFKFDFIIDAGQSGLEGEDLKQESTKLIKYFFAALTVPENELWVNLSPYEQDRIIPEKFGVT
ncbi:MAG: hypothetical protein KC733_10425 [Candidatus Omnitrophica bacterium]|nr:hypothetical protein [Candidatus Omnitrophota bacterium]